MKWLKSLFLIMNVMLCKSVVFAQPYVAEEMLHESAAPNLIGIIILSNPSLRMSSISDYMNGVSINHSTLQLSVSVGLGWSLQVRATDDLRYQTQSIPISSLGIQSLNLSNTPEFFLSNTNQTLASGLAKTLLSTNILIRYRTLGGAAFLKPAGDYTTTLVFTYTAQ